MALSRATACRRDFPGWPPGPEISNLPLRRMGGRSKVNSDGCQRSYKHPLATVSMIDGDSDGELDLLSFAEVDPTVSFIVAQPTRLVFTDGPRIVTHVPDYAIIRNGRAELYEAKGSRALDDPAVEARLARAADHVENWPDWSYLLVGRDALLNSPLRGAVDSVWRHHRRSWRDAQLRCALDALGPGSMRAADLVIALADVDEPPTLGNVLSMVAGCRLHADMASGVGPELRVRRPDLATMPESIIPCRRPETPPCR